MIACCAWPTAMRMKRELRKIKDEEDARRQLTRMTLAGASLAEWSRKHGLDGRSLNAWRRALEKRDARATMQRGLVELVPAPPSATVMRAASAAARTARYVVDLGGARVEVGDDFRADTLHRLLETLRAC